MVQPSLVSTDDLLRSARDDLLALHRRLVAAQARFYDGETMHLDWSCVLDAAVLVADTAKTLFPMDAFVVDECGPLPLPDIAAEPDPRTAPIDVEAGAR